MEGVRLETHDSGRLIVECGFVDKDNVEKIPGSRWDRKERHWTVPMSWAAMVQARGIFDGRLQVGDQLSELAWKVKQNRIDPAIEARNAEDAEGDERLTPLQRAGARFMAVARQALNADPQGAGKTPVTICALQQLDDPFPAVVTCPNGLKDHWRDEFATWWPEVRVGIARGGAAKRRQAIEDLANGELDVLAINWEVLRHHSRLAGYGNVSLSEKDKEDKDFQQFAPRTVILDEAHRSANPHAKQTRAVWYIGDSARYRYALTGTPVGNSPEELWSIMRFVAPDEYPGKSKWIDRYGLMSWNMYGGLEVVGLRGDTREELFKFLDPRFLRRPKRAILPQLPEKLPLQKRVVELPAKQKKPYDQMRKRMLAELEDGILIETNPAVKMLRLRQFCFARGKVTDLDDGKQEVDLEMPSIKVDEALEIIAEEEEGTKIAFFASTRKGIELLSAELLKKEIDHARIVGGDEVKREADRKRYQDRESGCNVAVCTYGAGAEGINLSSTDLQVYLERDPSFRKMSQAEERGDRPGRIGRLREMEVYAIGTVDERISEILSTKGRMAEEVNRDEEALKAWLT
jgi:SNF2 family DNA or RNA helicase